MHGVPSGHTTPRTTPRQHAHPAAHPDPHPDPHPVAPAAHRRRWPRLRPAIPLVLAALLVLLGAVGLLVAPVLLPSAPATAAAASTAPATATTTTPSATPGAGGAQLDVDVGGLDALAAGATSAVTVHVTVTDRGPLDPTQRVQVRGAIAARGGADGTRHAAITGVACHQEGGAQELTVHEGAFLFPTAEAAPTVGDLERGETFDLELTVAPEASVGDVVVDVALAAASSPAAAERLSGADRFATAATVSEAHHPDGADRVYLARGDAFPDALAAGPVAAADDAPLLLTHTDALPSVTARELSRLDPDEVVLLGGDGAISAEVAEEVEQRVASVERRFGADRVATAAAIARSAHASSDTVVVATSRAFPDALSGVPAAFALDAPVLLSAPDGLSSAAGEAIADLGASRAIVLGGEGALSATVARELEALVDDVDRVAGVDRFATSAAVATRLLDVDAVDRAFLATGWDFPDALAGGPQAARQGAPLLLSGSESEPVARALATLAPEGVVALGGTAVVDDDDLQVSARASAGVDDPERARTVSPGTRHEGAIVPEGPASPAPPDDVDAPDGDDPPPSDDADSPDATTPVAQALAFDDGALAPPDEVIVGEEPSVAVSVVDDNDDVVVDAPDDVRLALHESDGTGGKGALIDTLDVVEPDDGVATFDEVALGDVGHSVLHADVPGDESIAAVTSDAIRVWPEGGLANPTEIATVSPGVDDWAFEVEVTGAPLRPGDAIELEWADTDWRWSDESSLVIQVLDWNDDVALTGHTIDIESSEGLNLRHEPLVVDGAMAFTASKRFDVGDSVFIALRSLTVADHYDLSPWASLTVRRSDSAAEVLTSLQIKS